MTSLGITTHRLEIYDIYSVFYISLIYFIKLSEIYALLSSSDIDPSRKDGY